MKTLIIPLLHMVMAYHSGDMQHQYSPYQIAPGQNTQVTQGDNYRDTNTLQKTTSAETQKAATEVEQAKTVSEYTRYKRSFLGLAAQQPNNWLALYYVAYCDARIALLTIKQNKYAIRDHCLNGLTYVKKATTMLNPQTDSNALSELYVVASMLHWAGEQADKASEGFTGTKFSRDCLVNARQLNNRNPRVLYWDAWMKLNSPKQADDRAMGRSMALTTSTLFKSARPGEWPNWGKAENQELLDHQ